MFVLQTVSVEKWSQGALKYLLALAESPLDTAGEVCNRVGIAYRKGKTLNEWRNKYPGWRDCEREIKSSPEAAALFISRFNLPKIAKSMVELSKSGRNAVAAANFIRELSKAQGPKPVGIPDWMEGLIGQPVGQRVLPPGNVVDGEILRVLPSPAEKSPVG